MLKPSKPKPPQNRFLLERRTNPSLYATVAIIDNEAGKLGYYWQPNIELAFQFTSEAEAKRLSANWKTSINYTIFLKQIQVLETV